MKTVKVRIAVAVDPRGQWSAAGWSCTDGSSNDPEAMNNCIESLDEGEARYYVEAELAIPKPPETVEGTIERATP